MLQSKRIILDEEEPKTKLGKLLHKIYVSDWFDYIYKPYKEVRYIFRRLRKNYLFWKNVLRYDYDFDFHGHFRMLHYKLKTVHDCIIDDYAWQSPKDMKAFRICIKLAKRLDEDNYDDRPWRKIETKYGKSGYRFEPMNDGSDCSRWISNYGGDESEETMHKVNEERLPMIIVAEKCSKRDERNLYAIMFKYRQSWWS